MFATLPVLGVGLGFREPLLGDIFLNRSSIDFLEIVADHYLDTSPEKQGELELLADHFTLIPHAINLSLGSAEGVNVEYLQKLGGLIEFLDPPWWSEHVAFTTAGDTDIGHLSPLPFTNEAIEVICDNIAVVRSVVNAPLILENITYMFELPFAEMTETQFLSAIFERADCGMLLDVTNLCINAENNGYDPEEFLSALPLDRVVQLHFAGGHRHRNVLIDSHSRPTPNEVWSLMDGVAQRAPIRGMVLERDENIPRFADLADELDHAREIGRRCELWP
jgi:uncharacterized protein (UPF0276 family)